MSQIIKIRRGKDIVLDGQASSDVHTASPSPTYAVKPTDFKGVLPKMAVKQGDEVLAGDVLFVDKKNPDICITSPVSGEVAEVVRGARRAIMEVRVLADSDIRYKQFDTNGYENMAAEDIKKILLSSGLWTSIIQRPFGMVAEADSSPKAIYISGFDSAPLAGDLSITLKGAEADLQAGVDVLTKLAACPIRLSTHKDRDDSVFSGLSGVDRYTFSGPHPSGVVGIQIHHIEPINKGDVVWTVSAQHLAFIGRLFRTGQVDLTQTVVVAGSEVKKPAYYTTRVGVSMEALLKDNLTDGNNRVISGNVLTGDAVAANGYLGFYHQQVSVIPEGDQYEFLGWLFPSYARPTISNTFPFSKYLKKSFRANTNYHGELRAFVMTGEYEKVLPMDLMPVQLLKAVLAKDLDKMEQLGIYEVIPEDMALCEFVCTSKIEVQEILSEGIELMAEEG